MLESGNDLCYARSKPWGRFAYSALLGGGIARASAAALSALGGPRLLSCACGNLDGGSPVFVTGEGLLAHGAAVPIFSTDDAVAWVAHGAFVLS